MMVPFWRLYGDLPAEIRRAADNAFAQFERDPFHPSLQFKEINKRRGIWSARINDAYRVLGFREGPPITWFWVGSHTEYEHTISRMR